MLQAQIQLIQLRPKAEFIDGVIRIHEHDENVEMFQFKLGDNVPYLPICDELIEKMHELVETIEANKSIEDKKNRYEANVVAKRQLWIFAQSVEDALNQAIK